jgi:hypothetical protein
MPIPLTAIFHPPLLVRRMFVGIGVVPRIVFTATSESVGGKNAPTADLGLEVGAI